MNTDYWQLRALARAYYDAEQNVTRQFNRVEALRKRGHIDPILEEMLGIAKDAYTLSGKRLEHAYKQYAPPKIRGYQESTCGLGAATMAALVGCAGDFIHYTEAWWSYDLDVRKRARKTKRGEIPKRVLIEGDVCTCGVRDIYAYFGMGDPDRRRRSGKEDNFTAGSPFASRCVYIVAHTALRKSGGVDKNDKPLPMTPYYPLYRLAKDSKLAIEWTKGHAENHGIRLVAKAILKDIWRVQHDQLPAYGAPTPWSPRS